jgi:hypothetical protein
MRDKAFGEWLVGERILRPEGLRQALDIQASLQTRLDTIILDLRLIPEPTLLDALGRFRNTRTVSRIELAAVSQTVARLISPRIASRLQVIPFRLEGKTLSIATLDPGDLLVEDELSLITGCMVASYVTLEVRLFEALHNLYGFALSPQHLSIVRRSAERPPSAKPVARPADAAPDSAPVSHSATPSPATPRLDGRPPRRQPRDELLEVSSEDLDLFPSLRAGVTEPSQGPPAPEVFQVNRESAAADLGPEERLAVAAAALQNAEMRDDIADAVLGFCAPLFRRRMMLTLRGDTIMGWRGEGEGVNEFKVRAIEIPLSDPSVFVGLTQGAGFWLGPLPTMPRNVEIVLGLGGTAPTECFVLPVSVRDKTVCFLYGDNVDEGIGGLPVEEIRRLAAKASLAFQVYLMKSKIRTL